MSTDHPNRHSPCSHTLVLLGAAGVVVLGTTLVDPSRLWLLVVPIVFCCAAYGAGVLVDRAVDGLVAGGGHPPMVVALAPLGVGVAGVSFGALPCPPVGGVW